MFAFLASRRLAALCARDASERHSSDKLQVDQCLCDPCRSPSHQTDYQVELVSVQLRRLVKTVRQRRSTEIRYSCSLQRSPPKTFSTFVLCITSPDIALRSNHPASDTAAVFVPHMRIHFRDVRLPVTHLPPACRVRAILQNWLAKDA
jgi:hypothetical protein